MPQSELLPQEPRRIVFQKDVSQALVGPERYELALALRELSQRLGVTLGRYAIRSSWDRSTLSRFFSGILVPPAGFVEQLIDDGDRATGAALTSEARTLVRKLHRTALRSANAEAAALQELRDELATADEESRHLRQEASLLRDMVRQAREQLDEQQIRYRQLEQASAANRLLHRAELEQSSSDFETLREERDGLHEMLARLTAELAAAQRRAQKAEERCSTLERELEYAEHLAEKREGEREERGERDNQIRPAAPQNHFGNRTAPQNSSTGVTLNLGIGPELGARISRALDGQHHLPLTREGWRELEDRPGLYQLFLANLDDSLDLMYMGKSDHSLPRRLENVRQKIHGRKNTFPERMFFTYVYMQDDMSAFAPEQLILSHLRQAYGITPPWNFNGFGNKDAGRQRDNTMLSPTHFDMNHPINLDWPVAPELIQLKSLRDFLAHLKAALPYNFRYDRALEPSEPNPPEIPQGRLTADAAFRFLARQIGDSWQISALKGQVILYRERTTYPSAIRYYSGEQVEDAPDSAGAARDDA